MAVALLVLSFSLIVLAKRRLGSNSSSTKKQALAAILRQDITYFGFIVTIILLIAIPLLLQTYGVFAIAYGAAKVIHLPRNVAAPACLIGASNFFELAVAVAISLFGLNSGAALATVVGVLVEVPVMLSLVAIVNHTEHWFVTENKVRQKELV